MRLSDRSFVIDKLTELLKRNGGEGVSIIKNGFRYTLSITSIPDSSVEDEIGRRIVQFHKDRGCCDGSNISTCPAMMKPIEPTKPKRENPADEFEGTE